MALKRLADRLINLSVIIALFYLYFEREHYKRQVILFDSFKTIGRKLAIIIPFTDSEIPSLITNLKSWSSTIHPCKQWSSHIDLVFYHNKNLLFHNQDNSINDLITYARSLNCFGKVEAIGANLNPDIDVYPIGTSMQFFKLWSFPFLYSYDYFYWSEPDNRPCRSGWLTKLYQLATMQIEDDWWMIGTSHLTTNNSYDGSLGGSSILADHINGNAIYKVGNEEFGKFMEKVEEEFSINKSRFLGSFDVAIWMVARMTMGITCNNCKKEEQEQEKREKLQVSWWNKHKHKFICTGSMVNLYRAQVKVGDVCNENVYFIHGRNVVW